ncbi:MAG: cobalamin-binding protein [Elusimicrobia bacterium]|nr:cobalamin-binding protein [Elusimicrobiota bacterium]
MMLKTIFFFLFLTNTTFAAEMPKRIISLLPSITEQLYLLNVEDEIVGVTTFCDYPEAAKKKEKIGTYMEPNLEKILSLKPDIVLASNIQPDVVNKLKKFGINVFAFIEPINFTQICEQFVQIAKITGREKKADNILNGVQQEVYKIRKKVKKKHSIFVEIGIDPLVTVGNKTFINEIVKTAGEINVFENTSSEYFRVNIEAIIERNPDIILAISGHGESENENDFWKKYKSINAVKNKRIYIIDANTLCRPTPIRYLESLKIISNFLQNKNEK